MALDGLDTIIIPSGVTELPSQMTDTSLDDLVIPATVTYIPDDMMRKLLVVKRFWCERGSVAEAWAKSKGWNSRIRYIDEEDYRISLTQSISAEVGDPFDLRLHLLIAPGLPDTPYTLSLSSSDKSVMDIVNNQPIFLKPGKATLTVSSPELGVSGKMEIAVYKKLEDFSIPAWIFEPVGSKGTITLSVSDVMPPSGTNPYYDYWVTFTAMMQESNPAIGQIKQKSFSFARYKEAGEAEIMVLSASGVKRTGTLVFYDKITDLKIAAFTDTLCTGTIVQPDISMTIDGRAYRNIPASYTLSSSDESIARPTADGHLELLAPGNAVITATAVDGSSTMRGITVTGEKVYRLSADLKEIREEAFAASPVTIVHIPQGCVSIGARAFAGSGELHTVHIPASVKEIAGDAFDGCSADLIIIAPAGSHAAQYAAQHGYTDCPLSNSLQSKRPPDSGGLLSVIGLIMPRSIRLPCWWS